MSQSVPAPGGAAGGPAAPPLVRKPGSPETRALLKHLNALADSGSEGDQSELVRLLEQASTRDCLDDPKVRNQLIPKDLRIAEVFNHLRDNPSPVTAVTLSALARNQVFNVDWRLQELVIRALENQRPLKPESVDFLDAQSQPKSLNLHIVIMTLVENGSTPAVALFGRKLSDPKLDDNNKISWIRYQLLPKRRSVNMLQGVEKWLADSRLDDVVRTALVDALFNYQPHQWGGEDLPNPPNESETSADAAVILRHIIKRVEASDYPEALKNSARQTLGKLP